MKRIPLLLTTALTLIVPAFAQSNACPATAFDPGSSTGWTAWGGDATNTRHSNSLSRDQVEDLELKWAFGFPESRSVIGQPSVFGGRVFIGVDTGEVYSLDAETGCVYWMFKADSGVRTAPTFAITPRQGRPSAWTVFFGDLGAQAYALDAASGDLLWVTQIDDHASAKLTGAPQIGLPGQVLFPVSSGEEGAGANPNYQCCTFRGSLVALDTATGAQQWKSYTIRDEPAPTADGKMGPSGGAIWSAPTVDGPAGVVYVATGDAYSAPADIGTDAIIAMNLADGSIRWIQQETADDIWISSCMRPNAPEECGPDHDFGSPAQLVELASGDKILVAGQKSGNVWAHDPVTGELLWRTPLVEDTTVFGGKIVWGGASDGTRGYFGLGSGGIGAVQLQDGEIQWFNELPPAPELANRGSKDGPLTAVDGAVFSGGWDGVVRALDSATGDVIWEFNTIQDFETVNQVEATGGSMGAAGPVVADGKLFVPSGYIGVQAGMRGNVLLMFAPGE